jgi:hypothetical protein
MKSDTAELNPYLTRRRNDVSIEKSSNLLCINFPKQSLNFQLDFPFTINAHRNHTHTEQHQTQNTSHNHGRDVCRVLLAKFIFKSTRWLIEGFFFARPINAYRGINYFVFLGATKVQKWKYLDRIFHKKSKTWLRTHRKIIFTLLKMCDLYHL